MSGAREIIAFVRARLAEDELWAVEASRHKGGEVAESGVHWQWVEPETDTPVQPDPERDWVLEDAAGNSCFSLRSVENFSRGIVGPLPIFAVYESDAIMAAAAGHIVRHDPARVLRRVAADRLNVDEYERYLAERRRVMGGWDSDEISPVMLALAAVYADHPDYREEWRL